MFKGFSTWFYITWRQREGRPGRDPHLPEALKVKVSACASAVVQGQRDPPGFSWATGSASGLCVSASLRAVSHPRLLLSRLFPVLFHNSIAVLSLQSWHCLEQISTQFGDLREKGNWRTLDNVFKNKFCFLTKNF